MSSVEVSGDHLPYKYKDAPPPNWDNIQPMTGSHIPGVDTGARGGVTTFMSGGGLQTIGSGMGSFGGGARMAGGLVGGDRQGEPSGLRGGSEGADSQQAVDAYSAHTGQDYDVFGLGQPGQSGATTGGGNPYYYAGSVGDLTRGVQYDQNGFAVDAGQHDGLSSTQIDSTWNGAGGQGNAVSSFSPGPQSLSDQQLSTDTEWYDYAGRWLAYAQAVPSAAVSLDLPSIDAARSAYLDAANAVGTPDYAAKLQTATDAINTMVTVNGWHYGPAQPSGPQGPATLATVTVAPTPGELAEAGLAPPFQRTADGPGGTTLWDAALSGLRNADQKLAGFNRAVNDELVDEGTQDLRDGNQAGFIWNGVKYGFYNTFMPNSVEGAAANLVGGAVAGKLAALGFKAVAPLFARALSGLDAGQLAKAGFKSVDDFADAVGAKYQQFYDEGYAQARRLLNEGELPVPPRVSVRTAMGQYTDGFARRNIMEWLDGRGISEGSDGVIKINRYLRDPTGGGSYRIPDVYVHGGNVNRIYDGTIGSKSWSSRQIQDFYRFSNGADVRVTKPTELGGTRRIEPNR